MPCLRPSFIWKAGSFNISLGPRTLIMGIVNVTEDSFSGDGVMKKYAREKVRGLSQALALLDQGADILDIGGESSRPGASMIPVHEEAKRVVPLIKALAKHVKVPLSVDTYKPLVAKMALDAGASIVNLIKGAYPDDETLDVVRACNGGLVLMHMRGDPSCMQLKTGYNNVVADVKNELRSGLRRCADKGIHRHNIVIDPGIGFSKTAEQNLVLLRHLKKFDSLGFPVLVGTSRKSFIGNVLQVGVDERLSGTIASIVVAVLNGAHILRVHDVKPIKQAVTLTEAIMKAC